MQAVPNPCSWPRPRACRPRRRWRRARPGRRPAPRTRRRTGCLRTSPGPRRPVPPRATTRVRSDVGGLDRRVSRASYSASLEPRSRSRQYAGGGPRRGGRGPSRRRLIRSAVRRRTGGSSRGAGSACSVRVVSLDEGLGDELPSRSNASRRCPSRWRRPPRGRSRPRTPRAGGEPGAPGGAGRTTSRSRRAASGGARRAAPPPLSSLELLVEARAISAGVSIAVCAAASSIARGMPSRRAQSGWTAAASRSSSTKSPPASRAPGGEERTGLGPEHASASVPGAPTTMAAGTICSPRSASASRPVASTETPGSVLGGLRHECGHGADEVLAVVEHQQEALVLEVLLQPAPTVAPLGRCEPGPAATRRRRSSGSRTGASSHSHTPSRMVGEHRAHRQCEAVLPTPPTPTIETRRDSRVARRPRPARAPAR